MNLHREDRRGVRRVRSGEAAWVRLLFMRSGRSEWDEAQLTTGPGRGESRHASFKLSHVTLRWVPSIRKLLISLEEPPSNHGHPNAFQVDLWRLESALPQVEHPLRCRPIPVIVVDGSHHAGGCEEGGRVGGSSGFDSCKTRRRGRRCWCRQRCSG